MEEKDNKLDFLRELIRNLLKEIMKLRKIDYIILHHSATNKHTTFESVNNAHKERWNGKTKSSLGYYCGYTYYIDGDGHAWNARLDTEEGAHTRGYNKRTIGICIAGNFEEEEMNEKQIKTLEALLEDRMMLYGLKPSQIKLHCNFANTLCPGKNVKKWLVEYLYTKVANKIK